MRDRRTTDGLCFAALLRRRPPAPGSPYRRPRCSGARRGGGAGAAEAGGGAVPRHWCVRGSPRARQGRPTWRAASCAAGSCCLATGVFPPLCLHEPVLYRVQAACAAPLCSTRAHAHTRCAAPTPPHSPRPLPRRCPPQPRPSQTYSRCTSPSSMSTTTRSTPPGWVSPSHGPLSWLLQMQCAAVTNAALSKAASAAA